MTGSERRHQLIDIARSLFAERGYEGNLDRGDRPSRQRVQTRRLRALRRQRSLYAVVVDREMSALLDGITSSLTNNRSRVRVERVALRCSPTSKNGPMDSGS